MTIKKILFITSIFFLSCSREYIKPLNVKRNFTGSLWIVRHEISTPEKIDYLLNSIKKTEIKNLFVQVRGRGDSYYFSEFEPRGIGIPENFDPLGYLLEKTGKSDIKIHAWINVSIVLSPGKLPPVSGHILAKHPGWITYDYRGRAMTEYSERDLDKNILEGYFLDPAVPGVKRHIRNIVNDIVTKYDVAGIHLDFIRYPYSGYNRYYDKHLSDFGYNPAARRAFKRLYGVDPLQINRLKDSKMKRLFDQFRRDQVTEIVRLVNSDVKKRNKSLIVSAAVMPRHDQARNVYFQDWPLWLDKGYIDLACVMSYTGRSSTYKNYIDYSLKTDKPEKIFMGIQVNGKTTLRQAHDQIRMSYDDGFRGYIIFSSRHDREYLEKINRYICYDDLIYTN